MKKLLCLVVACMLVLTTVGCTKESGNDDQNPYAKYKVAMVSATVGTDEFILQALRQVQAMSQEYGFTFTSLECANNDDWDLKARKAAEEGYNLIVGVGWNAAAPFSALADEFSDVSFGVIDTAAENEKVMSIKYNTTDGCYVMGAMIAAAFPNDKKFGYIGNYQNQSNFEYKYGFMEGVKSLIPDAQFPTAYADTYADTSAAYNKAVEIAAQIAGEGHFIMGSVANSANAGIYQFALEKAAQGNDYIYTSGLSVDQTTADNPYILTGLTKNTAIAMKHIVSDFLQDGKVTGGVTTLGVNDDAFCVVGINFDANFRNSDVITDDVLAAGKKAAQDLKDGKVVLPYVMENDYQG